MYCMATTNPYEAQCLHCKHKWIKRMTGRPAQCPGCKRQNWDRPAIARSTVASMAAQERWRLERGRKPRARKHTKKTR